MQYKIAALTEIAVRGRTHIPRSGYSKDIIYVPEAESATRLAQQLCQLAKGSALLTGRATVAEEDYQLIQRAAFDSMPPARAKILNALIVGQSLNDISLPASTRTYALQELEAQGLIAKDARGRWILSTLTLEHLTLAGYDCCSPNR